MTVLINILRVSLVGLFSLTIWSCDRDQLTMTVFFYDNQSPGGQVTVDTLILDSLVDSNKANIDIYFCWRQFKIPYYLPTDGIYRDSVKEKECDMTKYPQNVKCYSYDEKNRVITMSVDGSGTMGTWNYKYDSLDRITNIEWLGHNYLITYNNLGLVTELTEESGTIKKRLEFSYR